MSTTEQMRQRALTRVHEVTDSYPSARSPMYRRLGVRQRWLFAHAGQVNPDFYGKSVVVPVAGGTVNLSALDEVPELIQRVEIALPGMSAYSARQEISLVSLTDPDADLAPRCMLRSNVLTQLDSDLAGVASIRVWYSALPASIALDDNGTTALLLDEPWDGLLELDLVKWIVSKTSMAPDLKAAAVAGFAAEETALFGDWEAHLRMVAPTVQRFLGPLTRADRIE